MQPEDYREIHQYLLRNNEVHMNRLRRDFAKDCVAIVERETKGQERYDAATHFRVMRALEGPLDRFYGRYRGDERSVLLKETLRSTRLASVLAFRQAVKIIARHVSGAILRQLRKDVTDEQPRG